MVLPEIVKDTRYNEFLNSHTPLSAQQAAIPQRDHELISAIAIAHEAGISSGNLCYHYNDKSRFIREIYEQMIRRYWVNLRTIQSY